MASPQIIDVSRPSMPEFDSSGDFIGMKDADCLQVRIEANNASGGDKRWVFDLLLMFSDYAGLESEWNTGTAVTVLEDACDQAFTDCKGYGEYLTTAQKNFLGYTPVEIP